MQKAIITTPAYVCIVLEMLIIQVAMKENIVDQFGLCCTLGTWKVAWDLLSDLITSQTNVLLTILPKFSARNIRFWNHLSMS